MRGSYNAPRQIGMNSYLTPPHWGDLLKWLLEFPETKAVPGYGSAWVVEINDLIKQGKLLVAAQEIRDKLGKRLFQNKIDYLFNGQHLDPGDVHRIIPHIDFRALVTTNFDSLLEKGYLHEKRPVPAVLLRRNLMRGGFPLRPTDPPFIFYMHGRFDEELVLGTRDFQEVMFNTPGYRQFLETLFSVYTVLFVGFSGDDPHLENILDRLASISGRQFGTHYLLAESGRFTQVAQRRWEDDRRVRIINYDNWDGKHGRVRDFFQALHDLQRLSCHLLKKQVFREAAGGRLKIFISYSNRSRNRANAIRRALQEDGHSLFMDTDVSSGDDWSLVLAQAYSEAELFIFIWDENADYSEGMQYEINYALYWSHERPMADLIVQVDDTPLPILLSSIQVIRVSSNLPPNNLRQLRRAVRSVAEKLNSPLDQPDRGTEPASTMQQVEDVLRLFKGQWVRGGLFGLININTNIAQFDNELLQLPNFDGRNIQPPWTVSPDMFLHYILLQTRNPEWLISVVPRLPSYSNWDQSDDRAFALFKEYYWDRLVEFASKRQAAVWIIIEDSRPLPAQFIAFLRFGYDDRFPRFSESNWQKNIYVSSLADLQELASLL